MELRMPGDQWEEIEKSGDLGGNFCVPSRNESH